MSETLNTQQTAEQRVFGDTFSLTDGAIGNAEIQQAYYEERTAAINYGETTWLSRTSQNGAMTIANLYVSEVIEARIIIDHNQGEIISSVHHNESIDPNLPDMELFEIIVVNAERYAEKPKQTKF